MNFRIKKILMLVMTVVMGITLLLSTSFVKTAEAGVTFSGLMDGVDVSSWTPSEIVCQDGQPIVQDDQEFRIEFEVFYIDFRWHIQEQTTSTVTYVLQTNDTYLGWQTVVYDSSTGIYGYKEKGDAGDEILRTLYLLICEDPIVNGRMTGGGSIEATGNTPGGKHGFELNCNISKNPNRLEVNWGKGNKFHLDQLTSVICQKTSVQSNKPLSDFDTYRGEGIGRFNGHAGYIVKWVFTDMGEPGKNDHAEINIYNPENVLVAAFNGYLRNGNHQAH